MFEKILIANRGEIACRIIRSARKMGIKTVAVFSEADRGALHVELADEAVPIGPAPSSESYLVIDKIVRACQDTGAQAVHPGFGFLAENAAFVEALEAAGIVFIGPPTGAIGAMGDKIESKRLAAQAKVNIVPGHMDLIEDEAEAAKIAKKIGYPVMIKASAGGGGKGMRIAHNDAEAREGFRSARNEARSSFGDERIFIEKFIEQPRHIEIQVLADSHGKILSLGERECSIQRRHQKVIEEAPSPLLDAKTRKAMGAQAIALARAVDYCSAGTVEFIADNKKNFYFLEMNTRIQVEHPVTEMVTGLDIVEWMIRIAAGEKLPFTQAGIKLNGWSLEARVYAEDPLRNFMPSIGRLVRYREPEPAPSLRIDSGVTEGSEISMYYDPMIAKVVTHAKTREAAIDEMCAALDKFTVRGISHNMGFLAALLAKERFRTGRLTTNFIVEEFPDGFHGAAPPEGVQETMIEVAAVLQHRLAERIAAAGGVPVPAAWVVSLNGEGHAVAIEGRDGTYRVAGPGKPKGKGRGKSKAREIACEWQAGELMFEGRVDGRPLSVQVERRGPRFVLRHGGVELAALVLRPHVAELAARMPVKAPPDLSRFLLSPMPGLLIKLAVDVGQEVKAGEELAVVEAMKMENILRAERDGTVAKLHAEAGASLAVDQAILEFE